MNEPLCYFSFTGNCSDEFNQKWVDKCRTNCSYLKKLLNIERDIKKDTGVLPVFSKRTMKNLFDKLHRYLLDDINAAPGESFYKGFGGQSHMAVNCRECKKMIMVKVKPQHHTALQDHGVCSLSCLNQLLIKNELSILYKI